MPFGHVGNTHCLAWPSDFARYTCWPHPNWASCFFCDSLSLLVFFFFFANHSPSLLINFLKFCMLIDSNILLHSSDLIPHVKDQDEFFQRLSVYTKVWGCIFVRIFWLRLQVYLLLFFYSHLLFKGLLLKSMYYRPNLSRVKDSSMHISVWLQLGSVPKCCWEPRVCIHWSDINSSPSIM